MKFNLGHAPAGGAACARWERAEATATARDLDEPRAAQLRPGRHQATLTRGGRGGEAAAMAIFDAVRAELLAARFFPAWFISTAVCGGRSMETGCTVLQRLHVGRLLSVEAPVRVVELVDEPERLAITLVTLSGHPERGVERYELWRDADRVAVSVAKAWALPNPILRLGWPVANLVQQYATSLSLRHFRRLASVPGLLGGR